MLINIVSWRKAMIPFAMIFALLGCEESTTDNNHTTSNVEEKAVDTQENVDEPVLALVIDDEFVNTEQETVKIVVPPIKENASFDVNVEKEKYRNKALTILDTSELIIDGASTLVVTFSVPLDDKQDFSALLRLVDKEKGSVDGTWVLSENRMELHHRYLEPQRTLILNIDGRVKAITGSTLSESYQSEIKTRQRSPMAGFASKGSLLPSQSKAGLPVIVLNVNRVDVNFYKVKEEQVYQFLQNYSSAKQLSIWDSKYVINYLDLVYTGRFDLAPRNNVQENILLDLSKIEELKKDGLYVAVMSEAGTYNYKNPLTIFSISNIGISVHRYTNNDVAIFAQALDTGEALENITITLVSSENNLYEAGKTNSQGFIEIKNISDAKLLVASNGKDSSFIEFNHNALDLSDFNTSGAPYFDKQLFAFGPRDLYRPGETVYMNALLRDSDGKLLTKQPIKVDILKPDGQIAKEFVWQSIDGDSGFYQTSYRVPDDAPTGKWAFRFNLGEDNNHRFSYFSVEEFLPERMAMDIKASSDKPVLNSQNVSFGVKGWYLYGAPAAGNQLQAQTFLRVQRSIPNLNGYQVGALNDASLNRHLGEMNQDLDSEGETQVIFSSDNWKYVRSPIEVIFQASLLDSGGRPVNRRVTQTVWPAKEIPAIRPLFESSEYYDWSEDKYVTRPTVDKGTFAEFEVVNINLDGKKVASDSLIARIIKERRDYYWTWSDSQGWSVQYNQKEFVVSEEKLSIKDNDIGKVGFVTDGWGSYRIEVVDTSSNVMTNMRFWSGYSWEDNSGGTGAVRPDQVKLSIDKLSYNVGDTAIVHVEAPTAGSGYISLESNDKTLWSKAITVPETGLDVEIPILDWNRHDIYINTVIVRPSTEMEVQTIKRAVGLLYLPMNRADRELTVTLDAPSKVLPEQVLPIKVKIDPAKLNTNKQVTVLLSAVDSGVLNITNFVTPDPFSAFLGRKRYDVDRFDVYGQLIEGKGRFVSVSFGGDSDEEDVLSVGGKKPLTEVKIVAQQLATVTLDENGEGIFNLPLPDFNGELRLMAQIWDETRFGRAEQKMIVASPLIVELSTPRFLAGGDRSLLALDLHNLTDNKQDIDVTVTTDGLIHLEYAELITLSLNAKERQMTQIPVISDYGYGQGTITVNAVVKGENTDITRSWTVGVRPGYSAEQRPYSLVVDPGKTWELPKEALTGLIGNTVESKLVISNQPPINIAQYIESLHAYPYGCLEQTTSGLYPSLFANKDELDRLGIKTESDQIRREKITLGIERILGMQRSNGGFGLWSKDSPEEYWLTVYATDFLLDARDRGYAVNSKALDKALNRIYQYIYDTSVFNNISSYYNSESREYILLATKAYALLILTQQNKVTPPVRQELNRLFNLVQDPNAQNILKSAVPVAHLAIASKNAGFIKSSETLMNLAFKIERSGNYYWTDDYGSNVRDNALVLSLLLENDFYPEQHSKYLFDLSRDVANKRYLSTQELNALFIAGWHLNRQNASATWTAEINGNVTDAKGTLTQSYHFDKLSEGISVKNISDKSLYLRMDISGYAEKAPQPTSSGGVLGITRSYYDIKGNQTSIENMKVGDLVIVMLDVTSSKTLSDILVADLLPAGLELENQNLENSSVSLDNIPSISQLMRSEDPSYIKHQEYRDDRYVAAVNVYNYRKRNVYGQKLIYLARAVTPGSYVVPAPYVESMYHAEWFAIGDTPDLMIVTDNNVNFK